MDIVSIKSNDVFTDSLVVAEGTGNSHRAVTKLIAKYSDYFKKFGKLTDHLKYTNKNVAYLKKEGD